jgi:hypothetical protein
MLILPGRSFKSKIQTELDTIKRELRAIKLKAGRGISIHGNLISHKKDMFYGVIVAAGPASEANYTDERYWIKEQYCNNSTGANTEAVTFTNKATPLHITATNINEIVASSHSVATGAYVQVWYITDSSGKVRFVFSQAV